MSGLFKDSISPETVGSILQAIADLLATATSDTEYNIIRFWKETLQQYRFLYEIMAYAARVIEIFPVVKTISFIIIIILMLVVLKKMLDHRASQ